MTRIYSNLNQEKALIWRIVHRDNIPWILDNGLYCGNASMLSDDWVHIGNPELTAKRATHSVSKGQGGFLNDYVPFYFTPFSPMMRNINSGYGGVTRRSNDEIVILVSSLPHLKASSIPFVFTDSHAYYMWSNYYTDLKDLDKIDWKILQMRDFKRDNDDPAKFERYQAEALVHEHCPVPGLLGMVCYTDNVKKSIEEQLKSRNLQLAVHTRPGWYF